MRDEVLRLQRVQDQLRDVEQDADGYDALRRGRTPLGEGAPARWGIPASAYFNGG